MTWISHKNCQKIQKVTCHSDKTCSNQSASISATKRKNAPPGCTIISFLRISLRRTRYLHGSQYVRQTCALFTARRHLRGSGASLLLVSFVYKKKESGPDAPELDHVFTISCFVQRFFPRRWQHKKCTHIHLTKRNNNEFVLV